MTVIDQDYHWKRIKKDLNRIKSVVIKVGIQHDAGTNETGEKVVDYAYANEFGEGKTPPRSFIGSAYDDNIENWNNVIQANVMAVIEDQASIKQAVGKIAYQITGDTVKKLDSIFSPPNSDYTIAKKKSSKPLVDTGKMRASILPEILG